MVKEDSYFHPQYWEKTKELDEVLPFQDEVLAYYKEYEGKMKKPDLWGKTVHVTAQQFPKVYECLKELAESAEIKIPNLFLYEDFYYGAEAKGSDSFRIEMSAKTLADFSPVAVKFLLAREICRIKWGMVKLATISEHTLSMIEATNILPGMETFAKGLTVHYSQWSRLANYTADCYGYMVTKNLGECVNTILALVLNNQNLVKQLNIREYLAQAQEIYLLDDIVSRYSQNDEKIPYGPLRIKNLLAYAASKKLAKEID